MPRYVPVISIMTLWVLGCGQQRLPQEPSEGTATLTVMTFNVNYGLAGDGDTLEAIGAGDADIVLLQETTADWEDAIREEFSDTYPHMSFHHCCGAGGLAVLSRFAFVEREYIESPTEWFPALLLEVDGPFGALQILNVHLHPPVSESGSVVSGYFSTPSVRLTEIETFASYLDDAVPTLVVGDFNEKENGKAATYLSDKGFTSVLPEFHPGTKTWRWHTKVGKITSRLDHIMYTGDLYPLDAAVLDEGRSDHLPVVATFRLGAQDDVVFTTSSGPTSL